MSTILDGKALSGVIKDQLKQKCDGVFSRLGMRPGLAIVLVGDNPASCVYVASKVKACEYVGINSVVRRFPTQATQDEVIAEVQRLAADKTVNGIMVQLPLPSGMDERAVLSYIPAEKDVDGLTAESAGKNLLGEDCLLPCTPKGIIRLIKSYGINLSGKNAVVIGRSSLVGKPLAVLLLKEDATVSVCHSKTPNLKEYTLSADVLVVAIGKRHFVTEDMVKKGAVVIDVGINRTDSGICGDVDFERVKEKASYITPVPGGVGPMTVAMLLDNAFCAFLKQNGIKQCDYDKRNNI